MWAVAVVSAIIVGGAVASACVSGPAVTLATLNAKPGAQVGVKGTFFFATDPVVARWNTLDGPQLANFGAPKGDDGDIAGNITVPADAKPGNYVVILTQTGSNGKLSQAPVRTLLTVVGSGGAAPLAGTPVNPVAQRPHGLVRAHSAMSTTTLVLIGLGVGGIGLFLAGIGALFASRRRGTEGVAARA